MTTENNLLPVASSGNDQTLTMAEIYPPGTAQLNITWDEQQGELPDPVPFDATEDVLRSIAQEAVAGGSVRGIRADPNADFDGYVVKRYSKETSDGYDYNRLTLAPKTPFG